MRHITPGTVSVNDIQQLILGGIGPRPIALVSTISPDGIRNLSPFSFFNAFGANPPTVAFSPARRIRDASTKDTYHNLTATSECVIQAVTYPMVQQVSLASSEYPSDVDEFVKTGLTPIPSDLVRPPRVAESPFQMECRLKQIIPLGDSKGSGNLAICEVLKFHVAEDLFADGIIQPDRIDLVARMGGDFYCRASGDAIFWVKKPLQTRGIGVDALPDFIRTSDILTGNNLGQLGNSETVPTSQEVAVFLASIVPQEGGPTAFGRFERQHEYDKMLGVAIRTADTDRLQAARQAMIAAKCALDRGDVPFGWKAALVAQQFAR
jgi:flavin reductase (DIM6/NTAB) family NADH-FMN oxidoreductase RutF